MKYLAQSDLWRLDNAQRIKFQSTNETSRTLGRFRQIFPLTIFPDDLIIEDLRIVHVRNDGPWSKQVSSIMATDIACVYASAGPFFGHVHIQSLTGGPEILVDNLKRSDVFEIRSLIEGIALNSREGLRIENRDLATERINLLRAGGVAAS